MTRIALVRHGETAWNRDLRIQGRTDIPLNDTGREQAAEAAEALVGQDWSAIYASPLSRARDTAEVIARRLDLGEVEILDGVIERDYGEAEGMDAAQLHAAFPGGLEVAGREARTEVAERVYEALRDVERAHPDASVLIVCHGGVIGSVVRHLTGQQRPRDGEGIPNGSVHLLEITDGEVTLLEFNGEQVLPPIHGEASEEFELTSPS